MIQSLKRRRLIWIAAFLLIFILFWPALYWVAPSITLWRTPIQIHDKRTRVELKETLRSYYWHEYVSGITYWEIDISRLADRRDQFSLESRLDIYSCLLLNCDFSGMSSISYIFHVEVIGSDAKALLGRLENYRDPNLNLSRKQRERLDEEIATLQG